MDRTRRLLNQLSSAFSRSPDSTLTRVVRPIADEFDQAAYTLQDLLDARAYLTATGSSLDAIVALLGLTRLAGESDDALRTRYAVEMGRRRISGTRDEVLAAINANSNLQYGEDYLFLEPPNIPAPSRNQAAFLVDLLKDDGYQEYNPDHLYSVLMAVKPVGVLPTFRHRRTMPGLAVGGSTTSVHTERLLSVMPGVRVSPATGTSGTRHTREDLTTWNQDFSDLAGWTKFTEGDPFYGGFSVSADGALHMGGTNSTGSGSSEARGGVKQTIDLTDVGEIFFDIYVTASWCLKSGHFYFRIGGTQLAQVFDGPRCGGDDPDIPPPWHRNIYVDVRDFSGPQEVAFLAGVDGGYSAHWSVFCIVDNVRFIRPA